MGAGEALGEHGSRLVVSLIPEMAIFLLVLAFGLLGDALRDVLATRLRGSTKLADGPEARGAVET